MKLILIGFGVVGQGFTEILRDKAEDLQSKHGFSAQIVAVCTRSRGTLYHPDGLDIASLLSSAQAGHFSHYPESDALQRDWDIVKIIRESSADAVLEMSHTNLETAQPALEYCHAALDSGKHLVLANKGPVALAMNELKQKSEAKGLKFRYEATVMAGTPTLQLGLEALGGCTILSARGILNGTTNFILTQMEAGMSYADALTKAQELGYAEADPAGDVEGWDAAGKVLILAQALFGVSLKMSDLSVEGITKITAEDVKLAQANGERWKLIATATPEGGSVKPLRLPINDPLASVSGSTNAVTFKTDLMGNISLIGAGAGKLETGNALLSDLLAIHRQTR